MGDNDSFKRGHFAYRPANGTGLAMAASNREIGGVVVAFAGFVVVVGAFRGTWRQTWAALMGAEPPAVAPAGAPGPSLPGTSAVPSSGGGTPGKGGSGAAGVKDAFHTPIGWSVDEGKRWDATIPNHGTHGHVSTYDAPSMVAVIKEAWRRGLRAGENPYTGDLPDSGIHAYSGSINHYSVFPGTNVGGAVDVNGDPAALKSYMEWVMGGVAA